MKQLDLHIEDYALFLKRESDKRDDLAVTGISTFSRKDLAIILLELLNRIKESEKRDLLISQKLNELIKRF